METLTPRMSFPSGANLTTGPRTPPETPRHPKSRPLSRRRIERSNSPASSPASIYPSETISPAKSSAKSSPSTTVHVEELVDGDAGYTTDVDVVYPTELEELQTASEGEDVELSSTNTGAREDSDTELSDTGISRRFSRLQSGFDDDAEFLANRQRYRQNRRRESKAFNTQPTPLGRRRRHSESVKDDAEETDVDPDGMADQDLERSARRLRRRLHGPQDAGESPSSYRHQIRSLGNLRKRKYTADDEDSDDDSDELVSDGDDMDVVGGSQL